MELTTKKENTGLQSNHQVICTRLVEDLAGLVKRPESTGLYLASPDAGMQPSVAFWALALEQGPGFMSPQNFPWTLANSPAAHLAIALGLQGPSFTFLGNDSVWEAALEQANWDLEEGLVEQALVVQISFHGEGSHKFELF